MSAIIAVSGARFDPRGTLTTALYTYQKLRNVKRVGHIGAQFETCGILIETSNAYKYFQNVKIGTGRERKGPVQTQ
jgi:hypothetical protein